MRESFAPMPADDLGADLEPVWDRLAEHASMAPAAGARLHARVQGAMVTEFERTRPATARRSLVVVRPLFHRSSLRSLMAAAALVALLGASVALAGAGVSRLHQAPAVVPTPTPTAEQATDEVDRPAPIVQPPIKPAPVENVDPDEDDGDEHAGAGDEDGAETDKPDADDGDHNPTATPRHDGDHHPTATPRDDHGGDEPSDEPDDHGGDEPD